MKRMVALAAGGIVLLGVLSVVSIFLLNREPSPSEPVGDVLPSPQAGPPPDVRSPPPLGPLPPPGGPPMLAPPIDYGPQPPKPPPGSWEAVTPVARPSALGPVGSGLMDELADVQPALTNCYTEEAESRFGASKISATEGADLEPGPGKTTILVLAIEASAGQARIVDAPVETRGSASNGTIACAQSALRGKTFPAPGIGALTRFKMPFSLLRQ